MKRAACRRRRKRQWSMSTTTACLFLLVDVDQPAFFQLVDVDHCLFLLVNVDRSKNWRSCLFLVVHVNHCLCLLVDHCLSYWSTVDAVDIHFTALSITPQLESPVLSFYWVVPPRWGLISSVLFSIIPMSHIILYIFESS